MNNTNQLIAVRRDKLKRIIEKNINPYPLRVNRTHKIINLLQNKDEYVKSNKIVTIAGRLRALRRQGKVGFGNIEDDSGRIQIFVKRDLVGEENYDLFKLLDLGDFIELTGECFTTQRGEYSVKAHNVKILAKNLRPIPTVKEKKVDGKIVRYDEFADIELRYRKRYLDLLLNPDVKETFVKRAKIIKSIRDFLYENNFLEVETPILQPIYGGANARPFITHHNTLNIDLYLRIATELYLKRLIVGGYEKVYELGKNFRNEGMDKTHNPEFTAIELYQAFADYNDIMKLTENIFLNIANKVFGTTVFEFDGHKIDLSSPWKRASMIDLIKEYSGFDASDMDLEKITAFCKENEIEIPPNAKAGKLIAELFEHYVEPNLIQPTFVIDFPKEISPLAKSKPDNPDLVERFELFIAGYEFANAFTELNDPIEQRKRLEMQAKMRELGDLEANIVDEDFLEAIEYGMPPMGGLGIGIDRMIMLFTGNNSIKDVILFPQMKPENN